MDNFHLLPEGFDFFPGPSDNWPAGLCFETQPDTYSSAIVWAKIQNGMVRFEVGMN